MRYCGLQERILLLAAVQPLEKPSHLALDSASNGCNIVSTTPSTYRSLWTLSPPTSSPSLRARDERTFSGSRPTPSIALDLIVSSVSTFSVAVHCEAKP